MRFDIADANAMQALGGRLASSCVAGARLFLRGELGAGKTTLIRGILRGLGYRDIVKSPTYALVETYRVRGVDVFHFDLYRLNNAEELETIGVRDYFSGDGICLVEWPERGAAFLERPDVSIQICPREMGRTVSLEADTPVGEKILKNL